MENKKLNLHQKLVQIRKQFEYLKKDAKGYNFQYVPGSTILAMMRPLMDELNVILKYDIEEIITESFEHTPTKGPVKTIVRSKMKFVFSFINADNPSDIDKTTIWTQIIGNDIQDMGAAQTYCMRYFLLGFFNIPNDKEDPDAHQEKITELRPKKYLSAEQLNELTKLLKGHKDIAKVIVTKFKKLETIPEKSYESVKKYILEQIGKNKDEH